MKCKLCYKTFTNSRNLVTQVLTLGISPSNVKHAINVSHDNGHSWPTSSLILQARVRLFISCLICRLRNKRMPHRVYVSTDESEVSLWLGNKTTKNVRLVCFVYCVYSHK